VLGQFTLATFADLLGDTFRVTGGAQVIEMELVAANAATLRSGERVTTPSDQREQFSIVFNGPAEPVLPQRIYRFEHDALGSFDLFIVPIGADVSGMQYEAVFG
jgi:hypothetical protein